MESADEPESSRDASASGTLPELSFEETRVLGCLLEKEMTTPEHYPLSLNALMNACNQRSNREPVVGFDSATVTRALEELRYKHLAVSIHEAGARVAKGKHILDRFFPYLARRHFALLAVLFLRGQQTLGEIRQRAERMHAFPDLESTQAAMDDLLAVDPDPLVRYIPAGGGRRVATFIHLFCGDPGVEGSTGAFTTTGTPAASAAAAAAPRRAVEEPTWREEIESSIAALRSEVAALKADIERLK